MPTDDEAHRAVERDKQAQREKLIKMGLFWDEDILEEDIRQGRLGRFDLDLYGEPPHPSPGVLGKWRRPRW